MSTIEVAHRVEPKILDGSTTIHVGWGLFLIGILGLLLYFVGQYWSISGLSSLFSRYVFGGLLLLAFLGPMIAYAGRGMRARAETAWALKEERTQRTMEEEHLAGMREVLSPRTNVKLDVHESQQP